MQQGESAESGVLLATAPSLVFVAVNASWPLYPAIIAAAVTAVAGLGYRLGRRQSPTSALVGIGVVAVCAVAAAVTGQARGFFLVPLLVPFGVILICLATIIIRRPLTGLIRHHPHGDNRLHHHRAAAAARLVAGRRLTSVGFVQVPEACGGRGVHLPAGSMSP